MNIIRNLFCNKCKYINEALTNVVIPSNKDIQSEVRKHKEFIRTIYQILISE